MRGGDVRVAVYTNDMTHFYVCHDSSIHVAWLPPTVSAPPALKERKKERKTERKKGKKKFYRDARRRGDSRLHVWWHIHVCDMYMTHSYVWHYSAIWVWRAAAKRVSPSYMIYMCDMTHSYLRHDSSIWVVNSFMCVTWLIHISYEWHDSFIRVTWLINMCAMTAREPPYHFFSRKVSATMSFHRRARRRDAPKSALQWLERRKGKKKEIFSIEGCTAAKCVSFTHVIVAFRIYEETRLAQYGKACLICGWVIRVTWLIHKCDMTHSYVWHDSIWQGISHSWMSHTCDMTHSCMWHESFICVTWLIHMRDVTHSCVWHDSFIWVIGLIHMGDVTHL